MSAQTLLIHTIEPGESEICVNVCKATAEYLTFLTSLGMDAMELGAKGKTEFLSPGGAQYSVEWLFARGFWTYSTGGHA